MEQEILNSPSGVLSPSEIALRIVQDCKLDELSGSACLTCANRILLETSNSKAILYCKQIFRDLEVSVRHCSAWLPG